MIRYKVVNERRGSCTVPYRSKYYRKYNKGDTVYAEEGSFGLMVFPDKIVAEKFRHINQYSKILKVKPIGRALKTPNYILSFSWNLRSLVRFYKKGLGRTFSPPSKTLCYRAVKVLD
jgi:hypothetical protein